MKKIILFSMGLALVGLNGCKKEFLDIRSSDALVVPVTLSDFQQLLSNEQVFNITPALGELGSDDYYTTAQNLEAAYTVQERNGYTWAQDVYEGAPVSDWNIPYEQVFYANVVLAGLASLPADTSTRTEQQQLTGIALFDRAFAFYNLAITFCAPYHPDSAAIQWGIPIRLSADINTKSVRGTLAQTFAQVIKDLDAALPLLPVNTPIKTFPCKAAAYGLLARIYLDMQQYTQAGNEADSALQLNSTLMDYNQLNLSATYPFVKFNPEVLFESELISYGIFYSSLTMIDSTLYQSYDTNDLRRTAFFLTRQGRLNFKGTYSGVHTRFAGIATDEMYLIRAECQARQGNVSAALSDLNTLRINRYKTGSFLPDSASSPTQALSLVLAERRKELVFRGIRWNDLRRLNQDSRFAITLERVVSGQSFTLPPNDPRYTWPIPIGEIQLSGIPQNPR
ncbi:MAG TPA: RagB/SusD family nutrient uptake outer membrane protein [Chitinophagaceae bacterium]|nr:RagB/SusD family nutrient uptake outer membrane protein [Chitinophagaceae bacterium]